MPEYFFGDLPIASALPLSLLKRRSGRVTAPVQTLTSRRRATRPPAIRTWRHRWRDDAGRTVIGLALNRAGYLLRFPRKCDFAISADATRIDVRPHRDLSQDTIEHLVADQVLPRCLAQRGGLVAHAAGIAIGHDIALFIGESGRGKSTLAGLFFRAGRTVLTDDCLMLRPTLDTVRAVPTYPSLRLKRDSAEALFPGDGTSAPEPSFSDKRRLLVPDVAHDVANRHVAALYFMGDATAEPTEVTIRPLGPAAACIRLMEQTFQLDVLDRDAVGRLLTCAGDVVAQVPAFTLDFPRDFDRTAELVAGIERHFAGTAGRSGAR
jgi:hypothetical protein